MSIYEAPSTNGGGNPIEDTDPTVESFKLSKEQVQQKITNLEGVLLDLQKDPLLQEDAVDLKRTIDNLTKRVESM